MVADLLSTFLLAYYLKVRPMMGVLSNTIEVVNEVLILVSLWLVYLFTPFINDPEVRYDLGYRVLIFQGVGICLNFVAFLYSLISKAVIGCRRYHIRKLKRQITNNRIKAREVAQSQ